MTQKHLAIPLKTPARIADVWVEKGSRLSRRSRSQAQTVRLSVDVSPALRTTLKLAALGKGVTLSGLIREVLEREFLAGKESS